MRGRVVKLDLRSVCQPVPHDASCLPMLQFGFPRKFLSILWSGMKSLSFGKRYKAPAARSGNARVCEEVAVMWGWMRSAWVNKLKKPFLLTITLTSTLRDGSRCLNTKKCGEVELFSGSNVKKKKKYIYIGPGYFEITKRPDKWIFFVKLKQTIISAAVFWLVPSGTLRRSGKRWFQLQCCSLGTSGM